MFLERDLRTSSQMFEFTFKMFAKGFATVPAKGMQEIPNQLAGRLPEDAIRLNTPATAVDRHGVTLASGEHIEGDVGARLSE
ncbi:MAG: FAD-dependent oxidoreductase [Verrucomicrobiales bacterium]